MKNKAISNQFFHPWHAIHIGENAPHTVNAIIEITQGSKAKYELDKETGFLKLDRILSTHLSYPVHYGFMPQTYCADNDPLDILIICSEPLVPLSIVEVTVLGGLKMIDNGEQDDKIIGIATHDPFTKNKHSLVDINEETLNTINHFFTHYKKNENKEVIIERFLSKEEALQVVEESILLYKKHWR